MRRGIHVAQSEKRKAASAGGKAEFSGVAGRNIGERNVSKGRRHIGAAAQTANSNESNSFNPRVRQLYMTVDNDEFGAHLLAGQAWTLATMNLVGIVPRTENTPLVIDDQYVPGFTPSQPKIRRQLSTGPPLRLQRAA